MAKKIKPALNPDDYIETELGYDLPVQLKRDAKSVPARDVEVTQSKKAVDPCDPDDFLETELGYEYEAGQEACE